VAGPAAAVGDDRGRGLHHRLPVRRRGVGDQHLARAELRKVPGVLHDPHPADGAFVVGERQHLVVGQAVAFALLLRGRLVEGRLAGPARGIDHLGAEDAPQHGPVAVAEGRLVDVELVRVDRALDDVLAEAPAPVMNTASLNQVSVSIEKITPLEARLERTIFWTQAESATWKWSKPLSIR
jgi:hypothetical protein